MLEAPRAGEKRVLAGKRGRTLYDQDFYYPDGRTEVFTLWGSEKGFASVILPVTTDRKVVAIRQYRHGAHDFMLELPGGLPEPDETPKQAVRRELLEETGYKVRNIIDLKVQPFVLAPHHDYRFIPFLGLCCEWVQDPKRDANEIMEIVLVPLKEWFQKIWAGEVLDNQTIGLSILALPHLANIEFME